MTTPPVSVERRVGQRFPYLLPISFRQPGASLEGVGFTQDLSSRGIFFFTDAPLAVGAEIEVTLRMPSEITLGESMPIRCRARVLRTVCTGVAGAENRIGVAVRLECYEYLPESPDSSLSRISALHRQREDEQHLTEPVPRS